MEIKIESKKIPDRFLYGKFFTKKSNSILTIFLSGLSGGRDLPLFVNATEIFMKSGFDVLRLNFCNEDIQQRNALDIKDLDLSFYSIELRNVIEKLPKKYPHVVFVGHSFGAIISILFLLNNKKYLKNAELVLWDQSRLPWSKKAMNKVFAIDGEKTFKNQGDKIAINEKFYKELCDVDSVGMFRSLHKNACIITAEGGTDTDAKKYYRATPDKAKSKWHILKKTNHLFSGKKAQKELFEKTLKFIKA